MAIARAAFSAQKRLFTTALTDSATTDIEGIGTLRVQGEDVYRWVYNEHGTVVSAGDVVCHTFANNADFYGSIADGVAGNVGLLAGVVKSTTIPTLNYGWIQVLGYNAGIRATVYQTTAITVGATLIQIDSQLYAGFGATAATAPLYAKSIIAIDTLASTVTTAALSKLKGIICCL